MAKPRSNSRSVPKKKVQKTPLLPEAVSAFFWRRLYEGIGGVFIIGAVFMLVALLSYYSGDPSWNTGAGVDEPIKNKGGIAGAYLADGLWQTLGLAAIFVPLVVSIWGWHIIRFKYWQSRWREFLWLLAGIAFCSAGFAIIRAGWLLGDHLGGSLGGLLFTQIRFA